MEPKFKRSRDAFAYDVEAASAMDALDKAITALENEGFDVTDYEFYVCRLDDEEEE